MSYLLSTYDIAPGSMKRVEGKFAENASYPFVLARVAAWHTDVGVLNRQEVAAKN